MPTKVPLPDRWTLCDLPLKTKVGRAGIEPATHGISVQAEVPEIQTKATDPTPSAAPAPHWGPDSTVCDPRLRLLIDAWPTVPDTLRAGILAMVKAAGD